MLKFVLGGAGSGKSALLAEAADKAVDDNKSVIVIVPEQFSFDSDKKLYEKLGCKKFNKILSLSFTSLAREIFEKYGGSSGEYADDLSKLIIMKKTVKKLTDNKQLHFFGRQAGKAGFISDALDAVTEFRQSGLSIDDFGLLINNAETIEDKLSDLALIYLTYSKMLEENGLKDSLTDISEAAANSGDFFENTVVFFDEFESFTGDQYAMIETIISQADDVYVSLRMEVPKDDDMNSEIRENSVFESVKSTWAAFRQMADKYHIAVETINRGEALKYSSPDLAHLNMNIMRTDRKKFKGRSENIKIAECSDLYEEADWICSEIKRLVREENYRYRDIAVMSRQMQEYSYIFEAAFDKYDIPVSTDEKKSVMHTSIMQYVSGIVGAISEKEFSSEMIFKYAKSSLSGFSMSSVSELENYCFEWSIDGKKWSEKFETGTENYPFAEETRKKIIEPLSGLRKKCKNTDCKGICKALFEFMTENKVQNEVYKVICKFQENELTYLAKEFKRLWDILINILESMAKIGGEVTLPEFSDMLMLLMKKVTYSVPPQTLDCVKIACAETARPGSPKAVFLAGANEGCFPRDVSQSGLLNETDRMLIENKLNKKNSKIILSRKNDELIADERLIVYKTLTYASERLYITYPLADIMGERRSPSSVLDQITGMFGKENICAEKKDIIEYCSTPKAAYLNLVKLFGSGSSEYAGIKKALSDYNNYKCENGCDDKTDYDARIKYLESIDSNKKLKVTDKKLMRELYTDKLNMSASAIDDFNTCHFKYFCKSGLKLHVLKKRTVDKIGEGNLTHKCLEKILRLCNTKSKLAKLSVKKMRELIYECSREFIAETFGTDKADMPEAETAVESICKNIETLIKHLKNELKQSDFFPDAFELDIGGSNGQPVLTAKNGVKIYLKGSIDRVDVYEHKNGKKYLRVIDYKTGEKKFSVEDLLYGINMQMILYLFAATGKDGKYNGYEPAGVLYMPSGWSKYPERGSDAEKHLNDYYKMNGLLLKDRDILNAMEKGINGVYIPAALLKTDTGTGELKLKKGSGCLSKVYFDNLRKYTDRVLLRMCYQLYRGRIEAKPFVGSSKPCDYCEYWSVCGNGDTDFPKTVSTDAEEKMMRKLGGKKNA